MPDDHSKLVPPLPIPNRTVKRLCADDSASTRVKVGHRQASYSVRNKQAPTKGPVCVYQCSPVVQQFRNYLTGEFLLFSTSAILSNRNKHRGLSNEGPVCVCITE